MARWENGPGVLYGAGSGVPVEIAASYRARSRGLLGRDGIEGALLLTPASGVHTFRMRFAIDVAYLSRDFTVLAVRTMRPGRLGRPASAPGTSWRRRPARWRAGGCGPDCAWGLKPAGEGGRGALSPLAATGGRRGPAYEARGKLTSTRRFFLRPSSVPLSAIGYCSP
ncbi:hypothetical protein Srufu_028350 [Streptomyces libani subsp. rufus]|nr:hypothetical protein Srufu_028350 [Streptomyces libani subsp. rufus]